MSDTIVVGTDDSVPSRQAIRWGAARAQARGADLRLVHVLDGVDTPAPPDANGAVETLLRAGEAIAREVASEIPISWCIARGDPLEVLSSTTDADGLLVIGTHKTGFIRGTLFGSRFLTLVPRAQSAVAYIPDLAGSIRDGVVVGVQDGDDQVIEFAAREASATAQSLTLVRSRPGGLGEFDGEMIRAISIAKSVDASLPIRSRRSVRPLAAGLVEAAARSSLLVVSHATDSASVALALDVLLNIPSPTLVTRP